MDIYNTGTYLYPKNSFFLDISNYIFTICPKCNIIHNYYNFTSYFIQYFGHFKISIADNIQFSQFLSHHFQQNKRKQTWPSTRSCRTPQHPQISVLTYGQSTRSYPRSNISKLIFELAYIQRNPGQISCKHDSILDFFIYNLLVAYALSMLYPNIPLIWQVCHSIRIHLKDAPVQMAYILMLLLYLP